MQKILTIMLYLALGFLYAVSNVPELVYNPHNGVLTYVFIAVLLIYKLE
jgi:hypothetical protein